MNGVFLHSARQMVILIKLEELGEFGGRDEQLSLPYMASSRWRSVCVKKGRIALFSVDGLCDREGSGYKLT